GQSAFSDLLIEEVRLAREVRETRKDGTPDMFAIRINWPTDTPVSYDLRALLQGVPQREWRSPTDTPAIVSEVLQAIATGTLPRQVAVESAVISALTPTWESADGRPLPFAGPELPEGQVDLASPFYVNRSPIEERCYEMILQPGALIRIKAPRQMGKTSLMARILNHAANHGYRPVHLSFHLADKGVFASLDKFLQWFCAYIGQQLQLPNQLPEYWDDFLGSNVNCKAYFEDYLLPEIHTPLALCLDEVDRVFQHPDIADDFFGLLRAWHEESKRREIWKKLRLVVVHSTEVYIPMNINQSPFNVGLPIELPEFTPNLVQDLAQRYGINWCETDVNRLMNMVGGHPFLVRLALYHIARQDITLETLLKTAPTESGFYNDHLRRHLWNLEQHPALARAMKEVVFSPKPVRLPSEQAFKLHSMGLVKFQGNEAVERCDLYRQYFRNRLDE
ncbi:MAG: AAA-like domain-containing protein, partial [Chroococcales cyanobacterium]